MSSQDEASPTEDKPIDPADRLSPADALPSVEPPSAGFIIQLFIIPGIIVCVIVLVWLMFTWLAFMGNDPTSYIEEMKLNRANSWQQAYNLSEELRQNEEYRRNADLARQIAQFLDELLDKPLPAATPGQTKFQRDPRTEEVQRRGFLCKALGEFYVTDDALPVLMKAASRHSDDDTLRVRLAALEAIALLAENTRETQSLDTTKVVPLLIESSRDEDHKIALRAVTGLAAVGTDPALARLEAMLQEPHHVDVHYNVATGLARHGNTACIDMLQEMLDPEQQRGLTGEPSDESRAYKRAVILLNGAKSVKLLAQNNSNADLSALEEPVKKLANADVEKQIRMEAASTLHTLQQRR